MNTDTSMHITWPWPPVDRLCHDMITFKTKGNVNIKLRDLCETLIVYILLSTFQLVHMVLTVNKSDVRRFIAWIESADWNPWDRLLCKCTLISYRGYHMTERTTFQLMSYILTGFWGFRNKQGNNCLLMCITKWWINLKSHNMCLTLLNTFNIPAKPLHNSDTVSVLFNYFYCMGICDKLSRHL